MLIPKAQVSEEVDALKRAPWDLLQELFTMPWAAEVFIVAVFADLLARCVRYTCSSMFYSYSVVPGIPPASSAEARKEQMRYWHELSEMGKWVSIIGSLMLYCGTIGLCALCPQPRAAGVVRSFCMALALSHVIVPLLTALACTIILAGSRVTGSFDGLLSVAPGIMDFLDVGVKTTEFLAWRVQRVISEEEMLRQVYNDRPNAKVAQR